MLLAVVPVMVSAYASMRTGDGQWFQRSGALMVLFSVAVESHRARMFGRLGERREPQQGAPVVVPHVIVRFWRSIPYGCYLSIFTGTLIWSYGDLLFRPSA